MTGVHRVAVSVAMYRTARTSARPPRIWRAPARLLLASLSGAAPHSLGDFALVEHAELGQRRLQRRRQHRSNPGRGSSQGIFLRPAWAGTDERGDLLIRLADQALAIIHVWRKAVPDRRVCQRHAVALGDHPREPLTPSLQQRVQLLRRLLGERARRGAHRCRDVRHDPGIARLGLGQWPRRLRKVTYLARVDDGKGQLRDGNGGDQGVRPASCRFEHEQRRRQLAELRETRRDASTVVGHTPTCGLRPAGEVELLFRHVNTHKARPSFLHEQRAPLRLAPSGRCELGARATVRARPGRGVTTPLMYDLRGSRLERSITPHITYKIGTLSWPWPRSAPWPFSKPHR